MEPWIWFLPAIILVVVVGLLWVVLTGHSHTWRITGVLNAEGPYVGLVTVVLKVCPCGATKTDRVQGIWTKEQLEGA